MKKVFWAFLAFLVSQPVAAAETITINGNGYITLTESLGWDQNKSQWPSECEGRDFCLLERTFSRSFSFNDIIATSDDGVFFTFIGGTQDYYADRRVEYSGSFTRLSEGVFTSSEVQYIESFVVHDIVPTELIMGQTSAVFIENPNAVPEPATWALMLLGFFGIGGVMRSRNQAKRAVLSGASKRAHPVLRCDAFLKRPSPL